MLGAPQSRAHGGGQGGGQGEKLLLLVSDRGGGQGGGQGARLLVLVSDCGGGQGAKGKGGDQGAKSGHQIKITTVNSILHL